MRTIEGIDFAEYLEFVGKQESQSLVSMSNATEDAWDRIVKGTEVYGDAMPWEKVHREIRFRPGELSIWAGVNGHGKSMILSQCTTRWFENAPVAVASMEMPLASLAERFAYQMHGGKLMSVEEFGVIMARTDDKYWVYDEDDSVEPDRILGMCCYCAKELSCAHIVVDSLVKCGLKMGDAGLGAQRDFIDRLCWIAKTFQTHIHLVHHMRKGDSENRPGGKFDVKGAGEITDMADNVLLIWRNKAKEDALAENPNDLEFIDDPDALLTIAKQRHGEWEGKIKLWFDVGSKQFLGSKREMPVKI